MCASHVFRIDFLENKTFSFIYFCTRIHFIRQFYHIHYYLLSIFYQVHAHTLRFFKIDIPETEISCEKILSPIFTIVTIVSLITKHFQVPF